MLARSLLAAAALVAAALPAAATNTNWGPHDAAEFGAGLATGAGTSLDDRFIFTLSSPVDLTASAVSLEGPGVGLVDASVLLFSGDPGSGTKIGGFTMSGTSASKTFADLAAGSYYYLVRGTVGAQDAGGAYSLSSIVGAVPEPATASLMFGGLGAVLMIVRRRRGA